MPTTTTAFKLGEPQVAGPLAVFPVFGPDPRLEYRAFTSAAELGAFAKELEGGASVRDLVIDNPTDLPLLIYEGEEVLGAQQNRTFDTSVLVASGKRSDLPVSCVEAGRWDGRRHDERMRPAPQAADPSLRRTKRQRANVEAHAGRPARADQGEVWDAVSARLADHKVESSSAALSDVYDGRRDQLTQLSARVERLDGQIGALATVSGRPVALDLVSRADVFAELLPRLAQGYALDALGQAENAPDPDAAQRFLAEALDAPRIELPTPGLGRAIAWGTEGIVGSGLEHEGELVQLCAFPAEPDRGAEAAQATAPIARPTQRRRTARRRER